MAKIRKPSLAARTSHAAASPRTSQAGGAPRYCSMRVAPPPTLQPGLSTARVRAILVNADKWLNGTVLHYFFFDRNTDGENVLVQGGQKEWRSWVGASPQQDVVRKAFKHWKDLDIGLEFKEVTTRDEAEIRIGFMQGDGSWSYLGKQALEYGKDTRTMNFGWDLLGQDGFDTALHEIGHALGLPHEHQNPHAGIEWNEEAVYQALAGDPNFWSREDTHYNILRKIAPDTVQGSYWDPDSVMHYPFEAGLIRKPAQFANGLTPAGGLSPRDAAWVKTFYPSLANEGMVALRPSQSQEIAAKNGEQQNFLIEPPASRNYDIRTFGSCDTLLALFEHRDGDWRYVTADDDSGEDRNASLRVKLIKGRRYVVRARLKCSDTTTLPTVMMW